jgi:hypothetical protein
MLIISICCAQVSSFSSSSFYCGDVGDSGRATRVASCARGGVDAKGRSPHHAGGEVKISKKAMVKVSAHLDAKQAKIEATRKEYLNKMEEHTAHTKHSLGLDKMLGEKKVQVDGRERDLDLCEATLVEAQS